MIDLHAGERVILERRQHWLPIVLEGIMFAAVAAVPFAALAFAELLPSPVPQTVAHYFLPLAFLATAWLLLVWVAFFVALTNYYLDVLLVTDQRVIYIEQVGLFARELAELRMGNIQDIKVEIVGLLASLLDFGNIHLQTAGEQKEFVVKNIHRPHAAKDAIARQCHVLAENRK